jgi:hypothetical protein
MFFSITIEEVQKLDDKQARELVARLCQAEVLKNGYDISLVTWGGDQRAPDGGVDVRVTFSADSQHSSDWLKRKEKVAIQVKAVKSFAVSDIKKEMGGDNHIPMLRSLADHGAYLIVSTKSSTADSSLKKNLTAMKDALSEFSISNVETDFYDARRVADWVNEHPAVFVWVKKELGQPISGWKPYGAWAYHESDITAEYILDDKAKLITPSGEAVSILDGINYLRQALRQSEAVRLVGLSGVGKTRLVQALFDERVKTEEPCLEKEFVIYGDVSDPLEPQPQSMLESLLIKKSRVILVVDNCGTELHNNLTQLLTKHPNNKVSLLTVEYDIREDLPDHTVCYRLESSSDKVIETFISNKFSLLLQLDVQKIVEFSDGNARVAYALANTAQQSGELAQLKNNELFNRLFHQKQDPNNRDLLITAKYASLVYSFNVDDEELAALARLSELSVKDFRANLNELTRRSLLQSRGCWRAVLPHAIANNLAKLVLDDLGTSGLISIFTNENKRFIRSFSRRLGYLHESKVAQDLVRKLLAHSGKLYLLENLSDDEKVMATNLAPVAPDAMLCCLESAVARSSFCEEKTINNDWGVLSFKLAYDPALFERSTKLLAHPCFNALDKVQHLFAVALSGTEATPQQRFVLLKEWMDSSDQRLQRLGFSCLEQSFRFGAFSSSMNFDFGARKRTYGWEPKTDRDLLSWYQPLLTLMDALYRNNKYKSEIRTLFLNSFSDLWHIRVLQASLKNSFLLFAENNVWLEAFAKIQDILYFRKKELNDEDIASFQSLLTIAEPKTDFDQLSLLLCSEQIYRDRELSYQEPIDEAISFGKQWANATVWLSLLPCLLSDKAKNAYHFGYGIACKHTNMLGLLDIIKTTISTEKTKPSLLFIHGLMSGWTLNHPEQVEDFLQSTMNDPFWLQYAVSLQLSISPHNVDSAFNRLLTLAQNATLPNDIIRAFMSLGSGCKVSDYTVEQLLKLSTVLMTKSSGLSVVLDVWYMAIFCARDQDITYQEALQQIAQQLLLNLNWSAMKHGNNSHHLLDVMDYAYQGVSDSELIVSTIKCFYCSNVKIINSAFVNCFFYFIERFPQTALDLIYDNQDQEELSLLTSALKTGHVQYERNFDYDIDAIMAWCNSEHDKFLFVASLFKLFKINDDTFYGGEESVIEPVSLALLRAASMHRDVLEKVFESFSPNHWSGSRANIMENRMQVFDSVDLSSEPELRSFWIDQRTLIAGWIEQERKQELERNKNQSERFE